VTEENEDVTEFIKLDPTELHLVGMGANGFSPLMAKAAAGSLAQVIDEAAELTKARWGGFCGEAKCLFCKETFGVGFDGLVEKARLKTKERNKLPKSAFALPETREYPIHDENHAHAALSMLHNATPDEQAKIKAAVHRRYPDIKQEDDVKTKKEGAPQASHEDKPVPSPEGSLGQTKENHPDAGAVHMDVTREGFGHMTVSFQGHPAPTADQEGHGSTAPEKALPTGEALSQTEGNTRKAGTGDGRGSPAPNGQADVDASTREAKTQTEELTRKGAPGDAEWEAHDAKLAEQAGELIDQLESREKAEESGGTPEASKLSAVSAEAISRLVKSGQAILDANAKKESDEMPTVEDVIKALDERDEARRAEKKEAKKARAVKAKAKADKKKMKAMEDEKEMAEKLAADPTLAARLEEKRTAKAAKKAAKAVGGLETVTKTLDTLANGLLDVQKTVAQIAGTPQPLPVLSAAGLAAAGGVAALRGALPGGTSAFKALGDEVAKTADSGDLQAFSKATQNLAQARLIAFERLRAAGVPNDEALARVK
jgi:hypothetical protein